MAIGFSLHGRTRARIAVALSGSRAGSQRLSWQEASSRLIVAVISGPGEQLTRLAVDKAWAPGLIMPFS
jgi:hypothetical protein